MVEFPEVRQITAIQFLPRPNYSGLRRNHMPYVYFNAQIAYVLRNYEGLKTSKKLNTCTCADILHTEFPLRDYIKHCCIPIISD